ncbi:hypothetical protein ACWJJH_18375 [Endozoicomonadaceae bacterium StTr2]
MTRLIIKVHKADSHCLMEVHTSGSEAMSRLLEPLERAPQAIDRLLYQLLLAVGVSYYGMVEGKIVATSDASTCWFIRQAEAKGLLAKKVMQSAAAGFGGLGADYALREQVLQETAAQLPLAPVGHTDIDSGVSLEPDNILIYKFFWLAIQQNWDLAWMGLGTYTDRIAAGILKYCFRRNDPWILRQLEHITNELIKKLPGENGHKVLAAEKEIRKWLSGK